MKNIFRIFIVIMMFLPISVFAFNFQTGSEININNLDSLSDNLYLFGGKVNFDDEIEKDLFVVSGEGNIKGKFLEDIEILSFRLNLSGVSEGDTRLFGGEININNENKKDLFIVGKRVNINSDSVLEGKTMIIGGEVYINGKVKNDLKIISAKTFINGEVSGNLEITTQELSIWSGAVISGDFEYFSPQKALIDSNSKIEKEINFNQIEKINENYKFKKLILNLVIFWTVIKFLSTLFITLILVFVFKVFTQKIAQNAMSNSFKSFFVGVLSMFLIPAVCIILFASLFAIPISVILFFFYLILWILTASVSGIILGFYIKKLNKKENSKVEVDFNFSVIGIVILTFVSFIPWIGEISKIIMVPLSFGSMFIYYLEIVTKKNILK